VKTSTPTLTFADRAALLTQYGIRVFPLPPRSKDASLKAFPQRATTDQAQIDAWQKENPNSNCAAIADDSFWFLDIDNPDVFDQVKRDTGHDFSEIDTLAVCSSGEKRHFYFKHDDCSRAMGNRDYDLNSKEAFSVRANNKYVVGPDSIHPKTGEPYEIVQEPVFGDIPVAPPWLTDWIMARTSRSQSPKTDSSNTVAENYIIPEGKRDDRVFDEACRLRDMRHPKNVVLKMLQAFNLECCKPPLANSVVAKKVESAFSREPRTTGENVMSEDFANIKSEPVVWLWTDRIPKGKLTIFSGNPDVGKTTVLCDIIARYTTGNNWGDGAVNACKGEVALLAAEDGAADTLKPRLEAAGADCAAVHLLKGIASGTDKRARMIALDTDLHAIEVYLLEHPQVGIVAIDPVSSYIGKADMNKEQELRRVLTPIAELAERTGVTFICLGHFSKRSDVSALHKVGGAVAMSGVSRATWLFSKNPETDGQYLMLLGKGNLTKKRTGLKYRIADKVLPTGETPFIAWQGIADTDADTAMDKLADPEEKAASRAQRFLQDYLTEPKSSKSVFDAAEKHGLGRNRRALFDAKKRLGVEAKQTRDGWYWYPPTEQVGSQESSDTLIQ
jgi:DNA repair protein RadA/Sms